MNLKQASTKLMRLLGPKGAWRVNESALIGDDRKAAIFRRPFLLAAETKAKEAMQKRRDELLSDPEYRRLVAKWKAAQTDRDINAGRVHFRRIEVGRQYKLGAFVSFTVLAEGDNWTEVIEKLEAKQKDAA